MFLAVWAAMGAVTAVAQDTPADPSAATVPISAPHGGLTGVTCAHCHDTPHDDVKKPCADCHTAEVWTPSTFTVEEHAATRFPLEGLHVQANCSRCHIKGRLNGLPTQCNECHLDRHRGTLGEDCSACHSVQGFLPVDGFEHAERTGFALTAPHDAPICTDCHDGDRGRSLRLTSEATCSTCHASGHATFSDPCETCHGQGAKTWADGSFEHRVTSFALERRHRAVGCAECHPVGTDTAPQPRCSTCHDDVHAGQLGRTCSDCHRPDRWTVVRFDHDQAGWPLRGRHFVAACTSCHTAQRWMGMRTNCWDCHAAEALQGPASVPAHGQPAADCGDCHNQWTWR